MSKVPFDSFVLAVVAAELAPLVGRECEEVRQPGAGELYLNFGTGAILISSDPIAGRIHLTSRRYSGPPGDHFGGRCVRALAGRTVVAIEQPEGDRVLRLVFDGGRVLIGEFTGARANVRLLEHGVVLAAARDGGPAEGEPYTPPGGAYAGRRSAFLMSILEAREITYDRLLQLPLTPGIAGTSGAYPVSTEPVGIPFSERPTLSAALEVAYGRRLGEERAETLRRSVLTALTRAARTREIAIAAVEEAVRTGGRAGKAQREAELLQAYGPGATGHVIKGWDHDGEPWRHELPEGEDWRAASERLFLRARHAKSGARSAAARIPELTRSRDELQAAVRTVEAAETIKELERLHTEARARRWMMEATTGDLRPDERPFGGRKIRQVEGPFGFQILYGETADANDWLTVRESKPHDLWLHVRGATGAHVLIRTNKKPDRVPPEVILEAARIAAHHSAAKHSRLIEVDVTERRYVRKPRGAPAGTVTYDRARTVAVNGID